MDVTPTSTEVDGSRVDMHCHSTASEISKLGVKSVVTVGDQLIESILWHTKVSRKEAYNRAVELLRQSGFKNVRNMTGGITAWSDKVDPSVPKY